MIFAATLLFSALFISGVAAYFSIIGLTLIFSGAPIQIGLMGIALETGKLVTASFVYRNWKKINFALKSYFVASVVILSIITSLGIFGYLSKSYISDSKEIYANEVQLKTKEQQLEIEQSRLTNLLKQQEQRNSANNRIERQLNETQDKIYKLTSEIGDLKSTKNEISTEIGPIKYIAQLMFQDNSLNAIDRAVQIIILILMLVFDPLAILLVVAANIQMKQLKFSRKRIRIPNGIKIDSSSVMKMGNDLFNDNKRKIIRKKKET